MLVFLVTLASIIYILYWQLYAKRKNYPPGPTPIPFLGNLCQVNFEDIHNDLLKWKKEYGGIFTVWLPDPYVIVSDHESLKEYFVKQGDIFGGRPQFKVTNDFIGGPYGLILNDNNWYKTQRRYALHVLKDFGLGRPMLQGTIIDQANKMVQLIEKTKSEPVDLGPYFTTSIGNVIFQLLFGTVREHEDPELHMFKENLDAVTRLVGTPISFLAEISLQFKKLDSLFGNKYKQAVEKNDKIIAYLQNEISRHKQTIDYENEPRDFIDAYLQEMKRREKMNNLEEFTEKQLTIAAYDFFAAGLDTTATTCRAFILYILYYPEVQSKIHEEMDNIIGKEHIITTSDQVRLPYLTAAMQELQRVAVLMPMNIHHIVLEDVQMGKNKVPKGTIVIPQFQSVHQDPDIYPEPDRFVPERHLDENGAFRKDDRITPFSVGKRACLGESLARNEFFLFISHLLQKFEFKPELPGKMPTIKYTTGLIRAPEPFKCRAIPRN